MAIGIFFFLAGNRQRGLGAPNASARRRIDASALHGALDSHQGEQERRMEELHVAS